MNTKDIHILIEQFKQNPSSGTYAPLHNLGFKMFGRSMNDWYEVTTYKSDFSDIKVGGALYNSPNINDVYGIWVLRK